jgi:outer membrane protein
MVEMILRSRTLTRLALRPMLWACLAVGGFVATAPVHEAHAGVPSVKKIAMVDMQRVLNETVAGKRARKELESSSKAKQGKLDKKRKKLEADAAKLQKLSGQQLAAAQEKLQRESMELQSMLYTLEQELGEQHNQLLMKMYSNAQSIVGGLAKEQGLDLVLVRDQMTIIFTKDSFDITSEVIKRYNAKHK